jgi:hypothetical protein
MVEKIEIRKAELKDAKGIIDIYAFWNSSYLDKDKTQKYFALKNSFTLSQIEDITSNGFATVALKKDKVISFYFINPYFDTGDLEKRKAIIKKMIDGNELPNGSYAYSLLSSTDKDNTGKGLSNKTLNLLRDNFKDKYDYFIGVMSYDNLNTQQSSLKMGWKHYGDIGFGLLAVIGTTDERNKLLKP